MLLRTQNQNRDILRYLQLSITYYYSPDSNAMQTPNTLMRVGDCQLTLQAEIDMKFEKQKFWCLRFPLASVEQRVTTLCVPVLHPQSVLRCKSRGEWGVCIEFRPLSD